MSDTQTRDAINGAARSNKSFPQCSEAKLFFVQAEFLTVHSISSTSNKERERERGGGREVKTKAEIKKVFPLSRNKDKTQECTVASQFMLTAELVDVKKPSLLYVKNQHDATWHYVY